MDKKREKLFKAIKQPQSDTEWLVMLGKGSPRIEEKEINVEEFLAWLPTKHHAELFELLYLRMVPIIEQELMIPSEDTEDIDTDTARTIAINALKSMDIILVICNYFLKNTKSSFVPPEHMFSIITISHDLILSFMNLGEKVLELTNIFRKDVLARLYNKSL
ncbi:hypothetical protein DFA_06192 [Cavenderia fasciculata]|uniref:Uncharacterized protein n=1 Tax=Cavenderia fasciculata TaxID=261658 RepID=F4PKD0_CACFS|nr:uncharacterized protein DFA_06192 [Cavenderia fasciculata]EGG24054.1 hypothetical protein DFA_06192 [Cavenderia fasciculata]|eukprot:XP_004361905.1 hypothetical protein DFA_06192 [Cavenderia fasciculata]